MKAKTYYGNLFLISLCLLIGLAALTKSVHAINQTKRFSNSGSWGRAETWGVWQTGQYYSTESDSDIFYYLHVRGKGWYCCDHLGRWFLNHEETAGGYWITTTGNLLISEWEGVSNGKHTAQRYPSSYYTYLYTSEDSNWDTATCFNNVNDSSCH